MGFTMGLNLLLLMAMVATNILSLYHLSSSLQSKPSSSLPPQTVPDYLIHQLHTIRATISHLTLLRPTPTATTTSRGAAGAPSDLLLYAHIAPIATACHRHTDLLHRFMDYTPFSLCPDDAEISESLILRGCHPLPRRRCFTKTPPKPPSSLPSTPFPTSLPDSAVDWSRYSCKSFSCLNRDLGFDSDVEASKFKYYKTDLDLTITQLMQLAKSSNSVLRLGLDVGGGTGTFAARMKMYNVTVVTTTMNLGAPYNEAAALRGLVPLHAPLQQRLPVFDGVVDLVRCGRAVNRWIPFPVLEFLFYDVDRVLRGGGYFWLDGFFSKRVDLQKVYAPLIAKLGYETVKWATANKTDSSGVKNGEVYLTALLQKPVFKAEID